MAQTGKELEAVISLAGSIDPSLNKAIEKATKYLGKINWKAAAAGVAVGGVAVATGKAVIEAGKYLANLGNDWQTTMNQLSASTGIAGEELDALGESVKNIYAKGLGEDFADVADGLAIVKQNSGLVGEELEKAASAAFMLTDSFGYEVEETSRTATALMKNFEISAEEAYGIIATGAQNGADKNGDLLDVLNEYSVQYAALGLSADQFLDSLVEGADAGLFSIDKVGDAVKEFNIRAKDASKSSADAFQSLGLDADRMFEAFAAGNETAQAAFFDTVEALNNLDDPLEKNRLGVALFGTQFEDLEAGVLPVLANIEDAAYDGAAALQQINDIKYNDLGSAFEQIKRTAEVTLLPMASMIANTLTDLAPIIRDVFESIGPVISETMQECMPFVKEFLVGMGDVLKKVLPLIADLAKKLLPILTQLVSSLLPPLLDLAEKLIPPFIEIVQAILPPIANILATILPMVTQIIDMILPILIDLINTLVPVIQPLLEYALQLVKDVVMPLMEPITDLVESLLPFFKPILELITSALKPLLDLLKPIADVLSTIVGWISKIVEWIGAGFGWIADLFTGGASNVSIPEGYATGGFTDGLSIAGEDPRYPTEAVISFNPAYRAQNLSYWARAGQMLGASTESDYGRLSGGTGTSIVYDLSGLVFSPQVKISGDADEDALIRKLRDLEPEFVDFVLEALSRREAGAYVTANSRIY